MTGGIGERAARTRAARGYAGLSQRALADELGISVETLSRMENGHRPVGLEEMHRIAAICGVPNLFMEFGFEIVADAGEAAAIESEGSDILRRLRAVERELEDLRRREQPDTAQLVEMFASAFREREPAAEDEAARGSVRRTARRSAT